MRRDVKVPGGSPNPSGALSISSTSWGRRLSLTTVFAMVALVVMFALLLAATASAAAPTLIGSFDGSGTPAGSMVPTKLAVDEATGDVYVIDTAHDVVSKFDSTGTYLSQIRGSYTTAGSFSFGGDEDIAVDNS